MLLKELQSQVIALVMASEGEGDNKKKKAMKKIFKEKVSLDIYREKRNHKEANLIVLAYVYIHRLQAFMT